MIKMPLNPTPSELRKFESDADKEFRAHRPLPVGRNFVYWEHTESKSTRDRYRENFDKIRWDDPQRCPVESELHL